MSHKIYSRVISHLTTPCSIRYTRNYYSLSATRMLYNYLPENILSAIGQMLFVNFYRGRKGNGYTSSRELGAVGRQIKGVGYVGAQKKTTPTRTE